MQDEMLVKKKKWNFILIYCHCYILDLSRDMMLNVFCKNYMYNVQFRNYLDTMC